MPAASAPPMPVPPTGTGKPAVRVPQLPLPTEERAPVFVRASAGGRVAVFHSVANCTIRNRPRRMRLARAKAAGLRPCSQCWIRSGQSGVSP